MMHRKTHVAVVMFLCLFTIPWAVTAQSSEPTPLTVGEHARQAVRWGEQISDAQAKADFMRQMVRLLIFLGDDRQAVALWRQHAEAGQTRLWAIDIEVAASFLGYPRAVAAVEGQGFSPPLGTRGNPYWPFLRDYPRRVGQLELEILQSLFSEYPEEADQIALWSPTVRALLLYGSDDDVVTAWQAIPTTDGRRAAMTMVVNEWPAPVALTALRRLAGLVDQQDIGGDGLSVLARDELKQGRTQEAVALARILLERAPQTVRAAERRDILEAALEIFWAANDREQTAIALRVLGEAQLPARRDNQPSFPSYQRNVALIALATLGQTEAMNTLAQEMVDDGDGLSPVIWALAMARLYQAGQEAYVLEQWQAETLPILGSPHQQRMGQALLAVALAQLELARGSEQAEALLASARTQVVQTHDAMASFNARRSIGSQFWDIEDVQALPFVQLAALDIARDDPMAAATLMSAIPSLGRASTQVESAWPVVAQMIAATGNIEATTAILEAMTPQQVAAPPVRGLAAELACALLVQQGQSEQALAMVQALSDPVKRVQGLAAIAMELAMREGSDPALPLLETLQDAGGESWQRTIGHVRAALALALAREEKVDEAMAMFGEGIDGPVFAANATVAGQERNAVLAELGWLLAAAYDAAQLHHWLVRIADPVQRAWLGLGVAYEAADIDLIAADVEAWPMRLRQHGF